MRECASVYPQLICAMSMSGHNGSGVAEAQYALKDEPLRQRAEREKSDLETGSDLKTEVSIV